MLKSVLIYGGAGQLGSVVVKKFKSASFKVVSVDFFKSDVADSSIILKGSEEDLKNVRTELALQKFDGVISVAGGFAMGSVRDDNIMAALDKMLSFNLKSAVACSHVAAHHLTEGGLLVLTGAYGALKPTPAFIPYGCSKAATHHLVSSLAEPNGGLPKGATVTAILPVTLDTPQNRKDMPDANFADWTPLDHVADLLVDWIKVSSNRPQNGALLQIVTKTGKTNFISIKQ